MMILKEFSRIVCVSLFSYQGCLSVVVCPTACLYYHKHFRLSTTFLSFLSSRATRIRTLKWRSQSPECYRYTIPLYSVGKAVSHCWIILAYSEEVVKKKWEFLSKKFGSSPRRRSAAFANGKFFAHWCGFWCSALHNRRIFVILKREIPAGSGIFIFAVRPALFS